MKRFIYSISVFLACQLLFSCTTCGCKRNDFEVNQHFDIQDMQVGFSEKQDYYSNSNSDTSISNFTYTEDSLTIKNNLVSLLIMFNIKFIAQNKNYNFSLINSAYACDPPSIGQSGSTEAIDSFYIVPIGRLGNDSVYVVDTFYTLKQPTSVSIFDSIYQFSSPIYNSGIGEGNNYNFFSKTKLYFNFSLGGNLVILTTDNFIRFRVVVKLKNGERYEKITNYIKLI